MLKRLRMPLLRGLRALGWYRALTGLPRSEVATFRGVAAAPFVERVTPLDPATVVELPDPGPLGPGAAERLALPSHYEVPATAVAVVREGRLYGKGVAVMTPDGRVLEDATVYLSGPIEAHSVMRRFFLPPRRRVAGTTTVLSLPGGNTYYHWCLELLPRLALLRRAGWPPDAFDHVVVPSLRSRFQRETIAHLGIAESRILMSDAARHLVLERMVVPSFVGRSGYPPPWIVEFLHEAFAEWRARPSPGPRRLYVSRARAKNRRVANLAALRPVLRERGIEEVHPEDLTTADQVALFAHAELVVAPHGSGLTNVAFCRPGAAVVELFHPGQRQRYYPILSALAGLRHRVLWGDRAVGHPRDEDFAVAPDAVARAIDGLLGGPAAGA